MLTTSRKKKKILILDDSPIEVRFMRDAIEQADPKVEFEHETDAFAAISRLKDDDRRPDIFLLDLRMPAVSGFEFLALMKEKGISHLPVIVMTNSSDPDDEERAMEGGADEYITKPHSLEGYLEVAEDLLTNWLNRDDKNGGSGAN